MGVMDSTLVLRNLKVKIREEDEGIDEGLRRCGMDHILSNIEKCVEVDGGRSFGRHKAVL